VAATRACERLILVGSCECKKRDEWKARFTQHAGSLPPNVMLSAVTPLQWVAAAAYSVAAADPKLITIHEPENTMASQQLPHERRTLLQEQLIERQPLAGGFSSDVADRVIHRLSRRYRFEELIGTPAVRSVTQLATEKDHVRPPRLDRMTIRSVDPVTIELSATEIGDATHLAMEHIDLAAAIDCASVEEQLRKMVQLSLLSQQQMDSVNVDDVCWFLGSDLGRLMRDNAKAVRRERTIYFPLGDAKEPRDRTMVRGRIDVLLALPDRCVVIDYKTDRTPADALDAQVEHHRPQLALYSEALERIIRKPVATYLAFLRARQNRSVKS
jgi:ATP-dependent exoDNAse (exonuclease V) beta subunit